MSWNLCFGLRLFIHEVLHAIYLVDSCLRLHHVTSLFPLSLQISSIALCTKALSLSNISSFLLILLLAVQAHHLSTIAMLMDVLDDNDTQSSRSFVSNAAK